jgi:hypothetical protein
MGNPIQVLYLFQHPIGPLLITFKPKSAAILALPRICGGGEFEFVWSLDKGGGNSLEELLQRKHLHSALKFSFLGKSPNLTQKPIFLRPLQGVPVTVFCKSETLLWVFLPAEPIFEKKKASSKPHGKKVFSWSL